MVCRHIQAAELLPGLRDDSLRAQRKNPLKFQHNVTVSGRHIAIGREHTHGVSILDLPGKHGHAAVLNCLSPPPAGNRQKLLPVLRPDKKPVARPLFQLVNLVNDPLAAILREYRSRAQRAGLGPRQKLFVLNKQIHLFQNPRKRLGAAQDHRVRRIFYVCLCQIPRPLYTDVLLGMQRLFSDPANPLSSLYTDSHI